MGRKKIQDLFGIKVFREFDDYKRQVLKKHPEEIFNQAYQNDCYINLYENLLLLSEKLSIEEMQSVIFYPNLLAFLYFEWSKSSEWKCEELDDFIYTKICQIRRQTMEVA